MDILPFTSKSIYIPIVGVITYAIVYFISPFEDYIIDTIIRSLIIVILFVPSMYFLKVSDEFNGLIDKSLRIVKLKK